MVARADGAGYVRSIGCVSWLYIIARPAGFKSGRAGLQSGRPAYNRARGLQSGLNIYIFQAVSCAINVLNVFTCI